MCRHLRGRRAETYVADLLRSQGWTILRWNWRTPYAEVDLLTQDPTGDLVIVEVKSASPRSPLQGEDLLRPTQRRRLGRAVLWLQQRFPDPIRVDLVWVTLSQGNPQGMTRYRDVDLV